MNIECYMHFKITSTQNPKIKSLLALEKPRERRKQCLFVVEGAQEVRMALEAGYKIGNIFFCEEIMDLNESGDLLRDDKLLVPVSRATGVGTVVPERYQCFSSMAGLHRQRH